jgi:hypothetical protein
VSDPASERQVTSQQRGNRYQQAIQPQPRSVSHGSSVALEVTQAIACYSVILNITTRKSRVIQLLPTPWPSHQSMAEEYPSQAEINASFQQLFHRKLSIMASENAQLRGAIGNVPLPSLDSHVSFLT